MGLISTQELLNRYYESVKGTSYEKTRMQIDRPELYAYEQKIGKELIDMTPDDLKGLFIEFGNKRKGKEIKYLTATKSSDQLKTQLNLIFEFYIDKVQPIKNPFNDRRMKGVELTKSLAKGREAFRWSTVEDIITGDVYINTHGLTAEQEKYNRYAPILMTSVDTDPKLCSEERNAVLQRLGVGKWQIFGAHGFKKDYAVNL